MALSMIAKLPFKAQRKTKPDKKSKKRKRSWRRSLTYFAMGMVGVGVVLPILAYLAFFLLYYNRVYPNVQVAGVDLGGMSETGAEVVLNRAVERYNQHMMPIQLTVHETTWQFVAGNQTMQADVSMGVEAAFLWGRSDDWKQRILEQAQTLMHGKQMTLPVKVNEAWWNTEMASLSAEIDVPVIEPSLSVIGSGAQETIKIDPGSAGQTFEAGVLREQMAQALATLSPPPTSLPVKQEVVSLTAEQETTAQNRAETLLKETLVLTDGAEVQPTTWEVAGKDLVSWVQVTGGYNTEVMNTYLQGVSESVNRPAQNAKFQFNEGAKKAEEFVPALDGLQVNVGASEEKIARSLATVEAGGELTPIELVMEHTKPEITLAEVNQLGINELLGRGFSMFKGSIASRVHNVALAASRINGTLVKPGETFSFNQAVGDISAATGYQSAYIIQNGRTILGDGGGVCQDSTTVFRAALNSGLPIVERHAHAYRVHYYEENAKAGLDATVFSPSVDLKFTNDTPAYLLIQTKADTKNLTLTVDIYGTSDGRKATISNQAVWGITPPPPDVYIDDPTLPTGQVKQVDWQAWGAKAKFDYTVTRGGETLIEKTFYSNFKPWAAVYMRGTGPT